MLEQEGYGEWLPATDSPNVTGRFEERPVVDEAASAEAGDYRYKRVIGIHTRAKHSSDISWQRLWPHNARFLIKRFPSAWEAFQSGRADMGGQRIAHVGWIPEKFKIECYGIGAETVEQLAEMPDETVKPIMGLITYRDQARARAADNAPETPSPNKAVDDERERLIAMARTFGVEIDRRWSNETLAARIDAARSPEIEPHDAENDSDERAQ